MRTKPVETIKGRLSGGERVQQWTMTDRGDDSLSSVGLGLFNTATVQQKLGVLTTSFPRRDNEAELVISVSTEQRDGHNTATSQANTRVLCRYCNRRQSLQCSWTSSLPTDPRQPDSSYSRFRQPLKTLLFGHCEIPSLDCASEILFLTYLLTFYYQQSTSRCPRCSNPSAGRRIHTDEPG